MNEMQKTLTRRSFAASRVRNLIAVLAIALTAVLFTSVTTIVIGTIQSVTLTTQIQKGSKSDGDFRFMTAEQWETLRETDWVEEAGLRMPVGFLDNTSRHNIEFDVQDATQAALTFCEPGHGKLPQGEHEVVASDRALRELGAEPEIGAEVIIEFQAHGQTYRLPVVVSGWYEATNDQTSIMWAGTEFRDAHPDIFRYPDDQELKNGEVAGTYWSDITVTSAMGLQDKMDGWIREQSGNPDDSDADHYILAVVNTITNPGPDAVMILMMAMLTALFVFCGYLLIFNVFDIAVMQEIRRFGLYRTIGMGKRQIKKLINRQTVWLSCMGIPLGLFIGFLTGRAALPVIMKLFSTEYKNISAEASPSPVIFLGAAGLTALTVYLSTRRPVRKAADIPPIEAFHYTESSAVKNRTKKSAAFTSLSRLALSNLGRNKRRSIFIVVSLMLCIVLLNCVGTVSDSVDIEKQVEYMIRTDFAVVNAASTNLMKGFTLREQALKEQTIADIAAQPYVTDGTVVYKNTAEDSNVTYGFDHTFADRTFFNEDSGLTFRFDEAMQSFGLGDDGNPICNVYGMEEASIARMDLREGETDAHSLYEKMEAGKGVLVGVPVDRVNMSMNKDFDFINLDEMITIYKDGSPVMEVPVLAKAAVNGDDEEIGFTCNGPNEIGGDGLYLYLPASRFRQLYEEPVIYKYSFNVEEGQQENMSTFLDQYMENIDLDMNYLSSQSARENASATRAMIEFVGGLLGMIFGIAGVLNLINTLITTILIRRHEFATMQSIGMTHRQLTKMMIWEGVYYAAFACVLGVVLAVFFNLTFIQSMLGRMWQFTYQFTLMPALAVSAVLLIVSAVIPILALKLFHKGSIVEQLRVAD